MGWIFCQKSSARLRGRQEWGWTRNTPVYLLRRRASTSSTSERSRTSAMTSTRAQWVATGLLGQDRHAAFHPSAYFSSFPTPRMLWNPLPPFSQGAGKDCHQAQSMLVCWGLFLAVWEREPGLTCSVKRGWLSSEWGIWQQGCANLPIFLPVQRRTEENAWNFMQKPLLTWVTLNWSPAHNRDQISSVIYGSSVKFLNTDFKGR